MGQQGVPLNLVDGGDDTGGFDELLEVLLGEVGDTNVTSFTALVSLDHGAPCLGDGD